MGLLTVAKVAVENTAYSFDMLFDYSVPDFLCSEISPGKRVIVQFGTSSTKRVGIVFSVESGVISTKKLKNISSVVDDEPLLSREMLKTAHFIHDRYFCTYFDACKLFLPLGLSLSVNVLYAVNPEFSGVVSGEIETKVYEFLKDKNCFTKSDRIVSVCGLKKTSVLDNMVDEGILLRNVDTRRRINDSTIKMVSLKVNPDEEDVIIKKLTKKQNIRFARG